MVKAAVLYETNQPLVIEDVEQDPPKAGEVRVNTGAAGLCASDIHIMHGTAAMALPVVLGHEGAGTVAEVGPGVLHSNRQRLDGNGLSFGAHVGKYLKNIEEKKQENTYFSN